MSEPAETRRVTAEVGVISSRRNRRQGDVVRLELY